MDRKEQVLARIPARLLLVSEFIQFISPSPKDLIFCSAASDNVFGVKSFHFYEREIISAIMSIRQKNYIYGLNHVNGYPRLNECKFIGH